MGAPDEPHTPEQAGAPAAPAVVRPPSAAPEPGARVAATPYLADLLRAP